MKLLGEKNWYLPKWLEWLPRLEHEASAPEKAPAGAPAPALRRVAHSRSFSFHVHKRLVLGSDPKTPERESRGLG
jgi:hypothetical protein